MFSSAIFIRSSIDVGYMTKLHRRFCPQSLPALLPYASAHKGDSLVCARIFDSKDWSEDFPEEWIHPAVRPLLLLIDIRPCFQVIPLSVHIHSHTMLLYRLAWKSRHQHQFKVELQGARNAFTVRPFKSFTILL